MNKKLKRIANVIGTAILFIGPFYLLRMFIHVLVYGQYVVSESRLIILLIEIIVLFYGTLFVSYKLIKSIKD